MPPIVEQERIISYLSYKANLINTTITTKQKQLETLEALKKSIIHKAVTQGLDDSVEMNDSGASFLGRIPKRRNIARLKRLALKIGSGVTPRGGASEYIDEGIPLLRSQNIYNSGLALENVAYISDSVHEGMSNSKVKEKDVLLNITGASLGRCYFLPIGFGDANVNQHVCIIRTGSKLYYKYLYYFLCSDAGQKQIFSGFKGASREGLNFKELKGFIIPVPTISEQKNIVAHLDQKTTRIENLKKNILKQIEILEQYRKSIVHECVIGKRRITENDIKEH